MEKSGKNYKLASIGNIQEVARQTLHDRLQLTGAEVSINTLPAGVSVPFVHVHKRNEEVYVVLEGQGMLYIDGEEFQIQAGDVLRIDPAGERCFKADAHSPIRFICIQADAKSLVQFTEKDGIPCASKPSWL